MKKTLVFDMDGTLLDSMGMWRNLLDDIQKANKSIKDLEPYDTFDDSMVDYVYKELIQEDDSYTSHDIKKLHRYIYNYFIKYYEKNDLTKDHVVEKLEELTSDGYKMYLATATDFEYAEIGIKANNLDKYLEKIYTPDTIGASKGSIEYYEKIAEDIGVNPSQIIFFDDAHYANVLAKEAGFKTVAVEDEWARNMSETKKIADHYIEDFSQIDDTILE